MLSSTHIFSKTVKAYLFSFKLVTHLLTTNILNNIFPKHIYFQYANQNNLAFLSKGLVRASDGCILSPLE